MFQTFDVTARPEQGPPRLEALRARFAAHGIDGFVIPRADTHQGEDVAPRDDRLAWLTGFTGSAGFCAALAGKAGVFIDGRYRTQVKDQVHLDHFTPVPWPDITLAQWLLDEADTGAVIGMDPWLHTVQQWTKISEVLDGKITLKRCANLVDEIWPDQPAPPTAPARIHPMSFAGEAHGEKCARLAKKLQAKDHSAAVITLPDSICWLLNIRGSDIPRTPVMHGFAVLMADGSVDLFAGAGKLDGLGDHLGPNVRVHDDTGFLDHLAGLEGRVRIDPVSCPVIVADALGAQAVHGPDPCLLPKACKNKAEIEGSAAAHLRDGAAIVRLLAWFDQQRPGTLKETDVVRRLEAERRKDNALQDVSFETISGTGPNGAIMHYRVTEETDSTLEDGHLLVLDSGGQYLDGTTDITRTLAVGTPPVEACEAFTRVLMGMIAMSRLRWPKGLAGRDIEAIARAPLWYAHQDFDHGVGHGVGAYLSVHEGPQRLSRVSVQPLQPGMILSNEPGYYREGAFGIRIENLIVVEPATAPDGGDAHREMLCWRVLTFAPIDKRLIVMDLLDQPSRDWLNAYHAETLAKIGPLVDDATRAWLTQACARI